MIIICFLQVSRESQPGANLSSRINYLFRIKSSSDISVIVGDREDGRGSKKVNTEFTKSAFEHI